MGKISHHRISRMAVQSASGRRGAGCPGPVAGIGDRRMLPQRLQGDLRLQRRIDLPSRLRRHHPLRLSQQNDPLPTTPRSHFPGPAHSLTASRLSFNQRISSIPERGEIPRRSRRCNRGRRRQGDEPATGRVYPAGKVSATDDPRARRPAGSDSRRAKSDGKDFGEAVRLPTSFIVHRRRS